MAFKIDAGISVYQLVVDGIEGDIADYGAPSFCTVGNEHFMALVEEPTEEGEKPNDIEIYKVNKVHDTPTVELVTFDEDEDDPDEGDVELEVETEAATGEDGEDEPE